MKYLLISILYLPAYLGQVQRQITVLPPPSSDPLDLEVASTFLKSEPWNVWEEVSLTKSGLVRGKESPKIHAKLHRNVQKSFLFCDFLTTREPSREPYSYVPAICVLDNECENPAPLALTEWGKKTCTGWAKTQKTKLKLSDAQVNRYVCCPLNGTRNEPPGQIAEYDERYQEFREIPSDLQLVPDPPYAFISGRNYRYMGSERQQKLLKFFNDGNHKAYKDAKVCGFVTGEDLGQKTPDPAGPSRKVHLWYPYLCVKPQQCGKAAKGEKLPPANPLWHQFCQERFKAEESGFGVQINRNRYTFPVKTENTHCCHINDMGDLYLAKNKGGYVATPQIPSFFNFAPGLRSVYKCEEYAKHVCDGVSPCTEGSSYPPQPGENPHMATLGVVAPRIMNFFCGGALVSLRYILSVESCRRNWGYDINIAMLGEHRTWTHEEGKEKFYIIIEILQPFGFPPAFRKKPWQDGRERSWSDEIDLALYRTDVEVKLSRFIRPACLFHGQRTWIENPQFIGWGSRITYRSEYLDTLPHLRQLPDCTSDSFKRNEKENPFYGRFGAQQHTWFVCLQDPPKHQEDRPIGHTNPCYMDHGGPLQEKLSTPFCSTLLLGMLSSQSTCGPLIPSVFINNTMFLSAIEDELWGNNLFIDLPAEYFEMPSCGSLEGGTSPKKSEFFFFNT